VYAESEMCADELLLNNFPIMGLEVVSGRKPKSTTARLKDPILHTGKRKRSGYKLRYICIYRAERKERESSLKVEGSESRGHRWVGRGGHN